MTLVELVITMSIMGILAVIAVVSMSETRTASKVEAAQKEVASEITLAKAYALQGKTQSGTTPCGYGVYFTATDKYRIYYNYQKSGKTCDETNTDSDYCHYRNGSSGKLDEKALSNGITATSGTDIYFTVPNARAHNAGGEFSGSVDIGLTVGSINKNVSVSGSGLVTIGE